MYFLSEHGDVCAPCPTFAPTEASNTVYLRQAPAQEDETYFTSPLTHARMYPTRLRQEREKAPIDAYQHRNHGFHENLQQTWTRRDRMLQMSAQLSNHARNALYSEILDNMQYVPDMTVAER